MFIFLSIWYKSFTHLLCDSTVFIPFSPRVASAGDGASVLHSWGETMVLKHGTIISQAQKGGTAFKGTRLSKGDRPPERGNAQGMQV